MSDKRDVGRGPRLGKYTARAICQLPSEEFQEAVKRPFYKQTLKRLLAPDFKPRKVGEPKTDAHVSELDGIPYEEFNIARPAHFAALIREYCHVRYSAPSANAIKNSLLENL